MPSDDESIFIDTNILIYATLSKDPRYQRAHEIVLGCKTDVEETSHTNTTRKTYTSVQNLSEMYPNLTGPKMDNPDSPEQARAKIEGIASLPSITVLPLTQDIITLALELCEKYRRIKQDYFDMQIAAFLLRYNIKTLYTENTKDFDTMEEVIPVNPFN
jgi:predicted nucleic acid-binding protein